MAFASIIRLEKAVQQFFENRNKTSGWEKEDVVFAVEKLLSGQPPLMVEAEIEADIHGKVTWSQCPMCQRELSDNDKKYNYGVCKDCLEQDSSV